MGITVQIKKRLGDFNLDVEFQGQSNRIGILGASGCGKSMTLKSIAGIEKPEEGRIAVDGKVFFDSSASVNVRPQKRNIGYLFQNYALFPTMTVSENIKAGLKGTKEEKRKRAQEMMEKFQIVSLAGRLPGELSGGQQQRAALARILAYEPDVILLDEPFSALDMFLKDRLQKEMAEMLKDYQGIVIMVSHSRDEIYRFSKELLVMENGHSVIYGETKKTGCKNIAGIKKIDEYTVEVSDWGILLHTENKVPEDVNYIGYRAHDFLPVWGERKRNSLKVDIDTMAEFPFEHNYYLFPEGKAKGNGINISWFVQREMLSILKEKGVPDYLEIKEDKLMFLA